VTRAIATRRLPKLAWPVLLSLGWLNALEVSLEAVANLAPRVEFVKVFPLPLLGWAPLRSPVSMSATKLARKKRKLKNPAVKSVMPAENVDHDPGLSLLRLMKVHEMLQGAIRASLSMANNLYNTTVLLKITTIVQQANKGSTIILKMPWSQLLLLELLTDNNGRERETEAPAIQDQTGEEDVDDIAAERVKVAAEAVVEASQ